MAQIPFVQKVKGHKTEGLVGRCEVCTHPYEGIKDWLEDVETAQLWQSLISNYRNTITIHGWIQEGHKKETYSIYLKRKPRVSIFFLNL